MSTRDDLRDGPPGWYDEDTGQWGKPQPSMPAFPTGDQPPAEPLPFAEPQADHGVLLDDLGSIDVYPSLDDARAAFVAHGGLGVVRIVTTLLDPA